MTWEYFNSPESSQQEAYSKIQDLEIFEIVSLDCSDMRDCELPNFNECLHRSDRMKTVKSESCLSLRRTMARAVGQEILKFESGVWNCTETEKRLAAKKVAVVVALNKFQ